jgi:hypothetical protein
MSDPALANNTDRKWTYADYKEWELKLGERYELIDGVAHAMSAPNTAHLGMGFYIGACLVILQGV